MDAAPGSPRQSGTPAPPVTPKPLTEEKHEEQKEILDEEFENYLEVAKSLMLRMKRPKDRLITAKYLKRLTKIKATSLEIKHERNIFFKYLLKVLSATVKQQPIYYDTWFKPSTDKCSGQADAAARGTFRRFMTEDERIYIAAKTIPSYGVLVYMAVAYDPSQGWQSCGFSNIQF